MTNQIRKLGTEQIRDVVFMALDLWKEASYHDLNELFQKLTESKSDAVFIYQIENENVGFVHLSIRNDYVEGSNSSPVGYVEGVYVKPDFRARKIAKELVKSGEQWAKEKGCSQIGSDIEYDNHVSYKFHQKIGFKEANRLICFIKDIE